MLFLCYRLTSEEERHYVVQVDPGGQTCNRFLTQHASGIWALVQEGYTTHVQETRRLQRPENRRLHPSLTVRTTLKHTSAAYAGVALGFFRLAQRSEAKMSAIRK